MISFKLREASVLPVSSYLRNRTVRCVIAAVLLMLAPAASAQVMFPLGGNGSMGLGSPNGDFYVVQDDLRVKVPGGYVRVNRDFDGQHWVFNRQWSGLGRPSHYKSGYASLGSYFTCTIIDGINSCDSTARAGTVSVINPDWAQRVDHTRVPSDPGFGRDATGNPLPDLSTIKFVARKGVGFTCGTDGRTFVSSKYPRFLVRARQVPVLPPSSGPDAHPAAGMPGQEGVATTMVNGFRWTDRSGQWIEYDNLGRITSYGGRNEIRVWFQYGSHGQIERVLDDNGRTVFTFLYSADGNFITEARDHTPLDGSTRRVQYQYDEKGRLRVVVDARGGSTKFDYGYSGDSAGDVGSVEAGGGSGTSGGSDLPTYASDTTLRMKQVTDAEGRITRVGYGITGRMQKLVAPDEGTYEIQYGYDKLKKEFSTTIKYPETDSGHKVETRHYDAEGRLVYFEVNGKILMTAQGSRHSMSYTDERGSTVTVNRNNFDEITKKTYSDGSSVAVAYASGSTDIEEVVDELGIVTTLVYDDSGNLVRLEEASGLPEAQVTEYEVNAKGEAEVIRRKGGLNPDGSVDPDVEVHLDYDVYGNVKQLVDGEGHTWKYEYDALGNMVRALDPLNHEWTYTYDAHGNRLSATDPNGLTTRFTYDKTGLPLTVTDPRGRMYRLEYDAAGRPQSAIDPTGATLTQTYDKAGQVISAFDSLNQKVQYGYDSQGRLASIVDGEGNTTGFEYADTSGTDRGSDLVSKINYPTLQRLLRYNSRQGVTMLVDMVDGEARASTATYSVRGLRTSTTNAYSKTKGTQYDAHGRPTVGTDELGNTVKLGYDHRGNLISVTDELGHVTRMEYDRRDRLVKETNAVGQATTYKYDAAGRLQELLRPNGFKLTFEFDAGGRLQRRNSYRPDGSLELSDGFTWDDGNRLVGWTTNNASSASTFDDASRLLSETVTVEGVAMTRRYTYHPNGQVATFTGPDGVTLTYSYDGNGDLSRVDIPGEGSISAVSRKWTEATKVVLPGGTTQEVERNGLLSPTQLRVRTPGQTVLFEQQSTYGLLGEPTSRTTQGQRVDYTYDDALRLLKADATGWGGLTETFTLDAADNRLSDNRVPETWKYDDANRLLQRGNVTYQYDAAGNLVHKSDPSLVEPRSNTTYMYDGHNRLIEVRDGAGQVLSRYSYDPFGYRLSKEVTAIGAANTRAPAGKRYFLQAEEGLLAEVAENGEVLQGYGWQRGQPYSTSPLFLRSAKGYFYYHNDPLGVPRQLTEKSGAVVWSATNVSAFGEMSADSGSAIVDQPWRLPGQYYDIETGFHYNLHRYYSPKLGRYVTKDPYGFAAGPNLYVYGNASPTFYVDPYGLWVERPNTGSWFADATFGTFYWMTNGWSPPQWMGNAAAGLTNGTVSAVTVGFLNAEDLGFDFSYVDKCSKMFRYTSLGMSAAIPLGRFAYLGKARMGARAFAGTLQSAHKVSRARNALKWAFRGGTSFGPYGAAFARWFGRLVGDPLHEAARLRKIAKYLTRDNPADEIVRGATKTNPYWTGLAGAALAKQADDARRNSAECGCN